MRLIALLTAIGLLKTANGLAWAGHVVGDAGIWIIDQYGRKPNRSKPY